MTNCIYVIMTSISGSGAVTISQTENVRENENNNKKKEDKKEGKKRGIAGKGWNKEGA